MFYFLISIAAIQKFPLTHYKIKFKIYPVRVEHQFKHPLPHVTCVGITVLLYFILEAHGFSLEQMINTFLTVL